MSTLGRFIRIVLPITLVIAGVVLVPMKVMDSRGSSRVEHLGKNLKELNESNRNLIRENEALRAKIRAFHSDPEYIEKVARDELGMVLPGEIIYQFPDPR